MGTLVSKNRSNGFIVKVFATSFAALLLICILFFSISTYLYLDSKAIDAYLLEEIPDNFVVVIDGELKSYPALKQAIETGNVVDVDNSEWERTIRFLDRKSSYIKYNNKYYGIEFMTAL
jgi:hypothetical protein